MFETLPRLCRKLDLGRVFRRMGLPGWTFIGVGIASIWFNTISAVTERAIGDVLGVDAESSVVMKGLILLVSNVESAMFAIRYHFEGANGPLERVWLVPSNEIEAAFFGKNTRDKAEEIKKDCEALAAQAGRTLAVEIHVRGHDHGVPTDGSRVGVRFFPSRVAHVARPISNRLPAQRF